MPGVSGSRPGLADRRCTPRNPATSRIGAEEPLEQAIVLTTKTLQIGIVSLRAVEERASRAARSALALVYCRGVTIRNLLQYPPDALPRAD